MSRKERGKTQNLFLVEILEPKNVYEKSFIIMGSTGNIYTVSINEQPTCTCPDFRLRHKSCKHIFFVLIRIMKVDESQTENGLTKTLLKQMFRKMPKMLNELMIDKDQKQKYQKLQTNLGGDVVKQKPLEDICPICLDDLSNGESIEYCKYSCGKSIHKQCFDMWSKHRGQSKSCVFCQQNWEPSNTEYINLNK